MNPPLPSGALRIGIDGEALRKPLSGVGHYVFQLCLELERRLPLAQFFVYARGPAEQLALPSERWQLRLETQPRWRQLPSVAWVKWRSPALIRQDRLDVYWAGRSLMPRLPAAIRTITTVHDLNAWIVPETMPFKHRWAHRLWFRQDVRRAHFVACNSSGTAGRLQALLGVGTDVVACPGVASHFTERASADEGLPEPLRARGIRPPYLVAVATLEPRKNLEKLLAAFLELKAAGQLSTHQLVLIGQQGWGAEPLRQAIAAASDQGVFCTGYLPDEWMPRLYRHADALVFPSLYEGFGMPVVEARSCGARVVVSDVPELREVAGADGVVVPPTVAGIRQGILEVLQRPRPDPRGISQHYSWGRSGEHMTALMLRASR